MKLAIILDLGTGSNLGNTYWLVLCFWCNFCMFFKCDEIWPSRREFDLFCFWGMKSPLVAFSALPYTLSNMELLKIGLGSMVLSNVFISILNGDPLIIFFMVSPTGKAETLGDAEIDRPPCFFYYAVCRFVSPYISSVLEYMICGVDFLLRCLKVWGDLCGDEV